jgi:TM2 domain-containing membrane protein YozV
MDQREKDRIAAELAAQYRQTIRDTAEAETVTRRTRSKPQGDKSMGVAYLFWFFFGGLGAHRLYLGYSRSGAAMLILGVFCFFFALVPFFSLLSFPLLVMLAVWWLADAILIPRMMPDRPAE